VELRADVYEYEARSVHVGQEGKVTLPYDPGRHTGRARHLHLPDPEFPTAAPCACALEFANGDFRPQAAMFANIELPVDATEGVVIPDSAVIDTGERQIVFGEQGDGRFETARGERSASAALEGLRSFGCRGG